MKKTIILVLATASLCHIAEARQPRRGYRGFFEWSNSLRSENFGDIDYNGNINIRRESTFYTGFATSHGYQIDPMFFVGAGLGMEHSWATSGWIAPVFIQGRIDLKFGQFTPFGDLRLGANLSDGAGVYFSPTIGYRFNWGRKVGINVGAGLTLAGYTAEHFEATWQEPDLFEIQYVGTKHHVRPYFSFRLGMDF